MIEIKGKYGTAIIYSDSYIDGAIAQIYELLEQPMAKNAHIRIMPDYHAGAGCVIGYTAYATDKIVPNLIGVDLGCFTGDTKVPLLNGTQKTLKELVNEKNPFDVYSVNERGKIVNSKAVAKKTKENAELLEVTISGGEVIRCTPDHRFMLRNGEYKEAKDLKYKDSLFPLYRTYQLRDGYESLIQPNKGFKSIPTHIIVGKETFKDIDGLVIHHINGNQFDNRPENLILLSKEEHSKIHGVVNAGRLKSEKFKKHRLEVLNSKGFYREELYEVKRETAIKNITDYMKNNPDDFKKIVEENAKRGSMFFSNKNSDEVMRKKQKLGKIRKILLKCKNYSEDEYNKYRPKNGYLFKNIVDFLKENEASFDDIVNKKKWDLVFFNNHKVISVKELDYKEDVYCLTVEKYHNFALSAGVFVHNCGVLGVNLGKQESIDFQKLDDFIRAEIPLGMNVRSEVIKNSKLRSADTNKFWKDVALVHRNIGKDPNRAYMSLGTLGGGK